jgi:hypothetical protein
MRDLIQLEAWVYDVVDRIKRGIALEDDRIEFKREWPPDYYKVARLIAGIANAARGGEVLLLVGVDPKQDPYFFDPGSIEPANWFPQVFAHFSDKHTPPHRIIQIHGTHGAPVAVAFDPDGAPFLVKNPNYGNKLGEQVRNLYGSSQTRCNVTCLGPRALLSTARGVSNSSRNGSYRFQ